MKIFSLRYLCSVLWCVLCLFLLTGNWNGLFFCTSIAKKTPEKSNPLATLSQKADSLFFGLELDSAARLNRQVLAQIPSKDSLLLLQRLNLQMRIERSLGHLEASKSLADTLHRFLVARNDTLSQVYAAWLCGLATNFIGIENDTAEILLKKSLALQNQSPTPSPDELQRVYRNLGTIAYYYKSDVATALMYQEKRQQIIEKWTACPPLLKAQATEEFGTILQSNALLAEAEKHYQMAFDLYQKYAPRHKNIANTSFALGNIQYHLSKYQSALSNLHFAIEKYEEQQNQQGIAKACHWIGNCLRAQGEDDLALEYLQRASAIYDTQKETDTYLLNDIALVYQSKKDHPKAIQYLHQILPMYLQQKDTADIGAAYLNLGSFHYDAEQYDSAIFFLQKRALLGTSHPIYKQFYFTMTYMQGLAMLKQNKIEQAQPLLEECLSIAMQTSSEKSWQVAEIYTGLATYHQKNNDIESSLTYNEKAIAALLYEYKDSSYWSHPKLTKWISAKHLLAALSLKTELLQTAYQQKSNIALLKHAFKTQELNIALIDSIRLKYQATSSKLSLMGEWAKVYENSIRLSLQLHTLTQDKSYLENAFLFAERSKATSLAESLQSLKAAQLAGIPDSLVRRASDLQSQIGFLENSLYTQPRLNKDSLQTLLTEKKENYQVFLRNMERNFPAYYKTKYEIETPLIQAFYKQLTQNKQELVEYYMGDSMGYVFHVSPNEVAVATFGLDSSLFKSIQVLRNQLADRQFLDKPEFAFQTFTSNAHLLYQKLLQPLSPKFHSQNLLIVPDGMLGYLPFEILLQKSANAQTRYANLAYLIKDFQISYAYSGMIWLNPLPSPNQSSQSCIAFAPIFEGKTTPLTNRGEVKLNITRQELVELAETRNEVAAVAKQINGDVFIENEATETQFKEKAGNYRVIHLATHALINDENPLDLKLVFAEEKGKNDGFLYVYELFGIRLNAELAVLSACNTGYGKIAKGEGVMSLARGFAQAGVPAIVMSLWTAQDKSTSEIMASFYRFLAEGQTKDQALRRAKLNYLNNTSKIGAHPYFWSAFVLVGNNAPLHFPSPYKWWLVGIGSLALVGILGWLFKKRKRQ